MDNVLENLYVMKTQLLENIADNQDDKVMVNNNSFELYGINSAIELIELELKKAGKND